MSIAPIIGYKGLLWDEGNNSWSSPYHNNFRWDYPQKNASCDMFGSQFLKGDLPHKNCECGIYAYHHLNDAINFFAHDSRPIVIVGMIGWGKVCIHSDRWRAGTAQVMGIWDNPRSPRRLLINSSEHFGVPVLNMEALKSSMHEFGEHRYKNNKQILEVSLNPFISGNPENAIAMIVWGNRLLDEVEEGFEAKSHNRIVRILKEWQFLRDKEKEVESFFLMCGFRPTKESGSIMETRRAILSVIHAGGVLLLRRKDKEHFSPTILKTLEEMGINSMMSPIASIWRNACNEKQGNYSWPRSNQ